MTEKKELKKKKCLYISLIIISTLFLLANIFLLYFNICFQYRGYIDPGFNLSETIRFTLLALATYISALVAIIISLRDIIKELKISKILVNVIRR